MTSFYESYKIVSNTAACGEQVIWSHDITKKEDRTVEVQRGGRLLWKAGMHNAHSAPQTATGEVSGFDMCLEDVDLYSTSKPYCVTQSGCKETPYPCDYSREVAKKNECYVNQGSPETAALTKAITLHRGERRKVRRRRLPVVENFKTFGMRRKTRSFNCNVGCMHT